MFSEVIAFGVKWPIRGSCVFKQVLKILHVYPWRHVTHVTSEEIQMSSLSVLEHTEVLCCIHESEEVQRSSRLRTWALSTEETESCQCKWVSRVCFNMAVTAQVPFSGFWYWLHYQIYYFDFFKGNHKNRILWELLMRARLTEMRIRKILTVLDGNNLQGSLKLRVTLTLHENILVDSHSS